MGTCRGFEDFCVLNARRTDEKYRGSYETSVMMTAVKAPLMPKNYTSLLLVVQITAEFIPRRHFRQVAMRCSDNTNVNFVGLTTS